MIVHKFPQYSPHWWDYHRGKPSGSNASKIITPVKGDLSKSAEGYAIELIAEIYDYNYGPRDEFATCAMKNGIMLEPEARRFLVFELGTDINQVGMCESDDRRFITSPDGIAGDNTAVEIKSPQCSTQIRYLLDNKLPDSYKPQCHWHMAVTGYPACWFFSYFPGLPHLLIRVERDAYTEKLEAAMEAFWTLLQNLKARIVGQRDEVKELALAGAKPEQPYF